MPGGIAPMQSANMGALISAAAGSPIEQLMKGIMAGTQVYSQMEQQGQEQRQKRQELQLEQQEQQAKLKEFQTQQGNAQWLQAIQLGQQNPQLRNSPGYVKHLQMLGTVTGNQVPLSSTGGVDESLFKTDFNDSVKDARWWESYQVATTAQREAMTKNMYNVPDGLNEAGALMTAKDQNAVEKLGLSKDQIDDKIKNDDIITKARAGYLGADGGAVMMRAQASMLAAQASMKRANDAVSIAMIRAKAAMSRAGGSRTAAGEQLAKSAVSEAQRAYETAQREYAGANAALQQAQHDGGGTYDSSTMGTLMQGVDKYKAMMQTAQQQLDDARSVLGTQPGVTGEVQSASGKTVTGVQNISDKFKTGQVYTDANGKSAKYLGNGQWGPP